MSVTIDIDLRGKLKPARDQAQRQTCLVFAASALHEVKTEARDYLSVEALYYRGAQRSHKDPTRGLIPSVVSDALQEDGQPAENAWPYDPRGPRAEDWTPPMPSAPVHRATLVFEPGTLTNVRRSLTTSTPVLVGVTLSTALYMPDRDAVVRSTATDRRTGTLHALVAVGTGHDDGGETYTLVRNSWGTQWGQLGHAWLHDAYLEAVLNTTAIIA